MSAKLDLHMLILQCGLVVRPLKNLHVAIIFGIVLKNRGCSKNKLISN